MSSFQPGKKGVSQVSAVESPRRLRWFWLPRFTEVSNNIPKEITDSLNMCATEDLEVIYQIVQIYVRKNNENTIYDKTCL